MGAKKPEVEEEIEEIPPRNHRATLEGEESAPQAVPKEEDLPGVPVHDVHDTPAPGHLPPGHPLHGVPLPVHVAPPLHHVPMFCDPLAAYGFEGYAPPPAPLYPGFGVDMFPPPLYGCAIPPMMHPAFPVPMEVHPVLF